MLRVFDFHVHLLGNVDDDKLFLRFAYKWNMDFGVSCLGADGKMLADPTENEITKANNMVIALMEKEPKLAHGFCYVNPLHSETFTRKEIRRCKDAGMCGIKLWIASKCSNPCVKPIAEECILLGLPLLQHAWVRLESSHKGESNPWDVVNLARSFPELKIVMAHAAHDWRTGIKVIKDCPNVHIDTSGFDSEFGFTEFAVRELGKERILYGSDAPGRDPLLQIGKVVHSAIDDTEKDAILYYNTIKLLGINVDGSKI